MRGKKLSRLGVAALLTIGLFTLMWLFSSQKYAGLIFLYRENKTAFEASAQQLQAMMAEIQSGETEHRDHSEYIKVHFRQGEGTVTLYQCVWREKPRHEVEDTEHSISDFPKLEESLQALYLAGVRSVYVYDFSDSGGASCEIWYGECEETLVYSADGHLTRSYNVAMADGGGYQLYQKKLDDNWFATVSRYDRDSSYWRT